MAANNTTSRKDPYKHLIELDLLTKYRELFRVVVQHDYFKSGLLNNLRITPANATLDVMRQYGLFFRQDSPSSFVVAYAIDPNGYVAIEDTNIPVQFTFWLHVDDVYFYNYTDLPFVLDNTIFYFNNLDKDKVEIDGERLTLSKQKFVTGEDKVAVAGALFTYEFAYPMENVNVQVVNEMNEIVFDETLEGEAYACTVNLTEAAPGKHTLLIDGLEERSFYIHPSTMRKAFGVIDVFVDKNDRSSYRLFDDDGKLQAREYVAHFKNRAVRWKYVLVENTPERLHEEHYIMDANKLNVRFKGIPPQEFDAPITEVTETGKEVVAIYTSTAIPFVEAPEQKFRLKTKKGRNKMDWTTELPVATPKAFLKPDFLEEDSFFSELFVYL